MRQINIVVVLLLCQSLQILGLRCYKCNQTEIFTRKCVLDSADEVECLDGEVCSYGRIVKGEGLPYLIGCEKKEKCDADKANGVSCETCDTDFCNAFARKVVSFQNRIEIINTPSGGTIIKEQHTSSPQAEASSIPLPTQPVLNNPFPFSFPLFQMPNFGFGFNNYGFNGGNKPQEGQNGFADNFFKPPFFVSTTSHFQNPSQVTQGFPPYSPFIGFSPFGMPQARPPYIHEPQVPVYAPEKEIIQQQPPIAPPPVVITPPRQETHDNEVTLQETVLNLAENNKPITTEKPVEKEIEATTVQDFDKTTLKPPSLASSILQQFPSNPPETDRNPSISDLVLNLGASTIKPTEKPLEATTKKESLNIPLTIPATIEEINTENPQVTNWQTNKDVLALQSTTSATTVDKNDFISPTRRPTTKAPVAEIRTIEEEAKIEEDDDENVVEPSMSEPENLRFNIRQKDTTEEVKFPADAETNYYFETQQGEVSFEGSDQKSSEEPVFSKL